MPLALAEALHLALIAVLLLHLVLAGGVVWLIVDHLRLRRRALADERRRLAAPLPVDALLPGVLVQVPTYNEGRLVLRAAAAIAHLDWPRDRLRVQVLDDSTGGSLAFAEAAVAQLKHAGLAAELLHRSERGGFKAGALAAGLRRASEPFVAIFDADYVPPAGFLRDCMRVMLAEADLALVQARCDFLNADENWITRVQQRLLDAHFAVEQATRSWTGRILPFNGTCGVWRRAAIDAAGGWQGDTLAEDLDLSYRVQLAGWRARYLLTVTAPGELPADLETWRHQQFRWTKGFTEAARKLSRRVWRSELPLGRKLQASLHLSENLAGSLNLVELALALLDFLWGRGVTLTVVLLLVLVQGTAKLAGAATVLLGQQTVRGASIAAEIRRLPMIAGVAAYGVVATVRGIFDALIGRGTAFVRTPKKSAAGSEN